MTLKIVDHPIKECIDDNVALFNKAHSEGKVKSVLFWYSTTDGQEYIFRMNLNHLEALGMCTLLEDIIIKDFNAN